MAATVNLAFDLGETWVIDATCHDSLGAVIDLSSALAIKWRLSLNGASVLDLAVGGGVTLVGGGTGGEILITITPAMQAALAQGYYQHQCRVTLADGSITDQFGGSLKARQSLF